MQLYIIIGLVATLLVLWVISKHYSYYFKMFLFFIGNAVVPTLILPFLFLRPRDYRNAMFPAAACRMVGRMIGVTMEVKGLENVKKDHGSIILINHQSAIDLLCLAYLWPVIGRATVVAKIEILYFPFFGLAGYLWGTLFINRKNLKSSVQALGKEAKAITEQNAKLLIFPEGSRNSKPELLEFKKGPFHIALDSKCTIQPVVISNYHFLDWSEKKFGRGKVTINILPEVSTSDYSKERIQDLVHDCREIMQREYTHSSSKNLECRRKSAKVE